MIRTTTCMNESLPSVEHKMMLCESFLLLMGFSNRFEKEIKLSNVFKFNFCSSRMLPTILAVLWSSELKRKH